MPNMCCQLKIIFIKHLYTLKLIHIYIVWPEFKIIPRKCFQFDISVQVYEFGLVVLP